MQVIRDPASLSQVSDPAIRQLIQHRIATLASDEPFDSGIHGYFLVPEEGDRYADITAQLGFDPAQRPWEILEEYPSCYDLLFIIDDSGYGIELFIPKTIDIPDLIAMCQQFAVPGGSL
jgi:hypothetical protein